MKGDALDPKGLIYESYRIDGITRAECRTIFMDWALSYGDEPKRAIAELLNRYGSATDHPMTQTLREGLETAEAPRRRGGRDGRIAERG